MQHPLKFDIKLSFTSEILKNESDEKEISSFVEHLLNKKINIHLKINLDKLQQYFKSKKLLNQKYIVNDYSEQDLIINNSIEENSNDSVIELEKEIIPRINIEVEEETKNRFHRSISNEKVNKLDNLNLATLVLDLDETLVYVTDTKNDNFELPQIPFEYYILDESKSTIQKFIKNNEIKNFRKAKSFVTIRPGLSKFLTYAKKYFYEIIIFTSSQYSYAEEIIKIIDKDKLISKIYSRKDCSFYNDVFYKDLNKIKKDLSQTIIIDNYPECYLLQHFNGLPIPSFTGNKNDNELLKLMPILAKLSKVKDVRNYIRQIVDNNGEKILFNKAYEILKIKKEEKNKINLNNDFFKNKIINNKKTNSLINTTIKDNSWRKKNLRISEYMSKANNNTMENISEDKIIKNDISNYYYIEKDAKNINPFIPSITPNCSKRKKNDSCISMKSSSTTKIKSKNKKRMKNLILESIKHNKMLSNSSQYNYLIPNHKELYSMTYTNSNENCMETKEPIQESGYDNINTIYNFANNTISKNMNLNSIKHIKSKSLNNNDINLLKTKNVSRTMHNSRNISTKDKLSIIND